MSDKNNLLEYKDEHFGKMFVNRPVNFADAARGSLNQWSGSRELRRFPHDLHLFVFDGTGRDIGSDGRHVIDFYAALDINSFYDGQDRLYSIKFPKKIPLMATEEFSVTHNITKTKIDLCKVLCIFPDYIKVPVQVRKIQYYGQKSWFQPYAKSTADVEKLLREIKVKYSRKY